MEHPGELLDTRRTYTFYVDDALIDHFAPKIGVTGVAVYILLVRHAKHHRAFPSFTRISERLGISRRTVMRILPDLQAQGLITIEKRRSEHGDADTNLYVIQDLSYLRGGDTRKPPSDTRKPPSDTRKPQVVTPGNQGSDTRKLEGSSLKESHLKEVEKRERSVTAPPTPETPPACVNCPSKQQPAAPKTAKLPQPARSRKAPADFGITDALRQWAHKEVPGVDIDRETAKWLDHEYDRPKSDWVGTWRNWMRRAVDMHPRTSTSPKPLISPEEARKRRRQVSRTLAIANGEEYPAEETD